MTKKPPKTSDDGPPKYLEALRKIVAELQDWRGHHPNCMDCPLKLTCLADRHVGFYCFKCHTWNVAQPRMMLRCDALHKGELVPTGTCPVCDNGEPLTDQIVYEGATLSRTNLLNTVYKNGKNK